MRITSFTAAAAALWLVMAPACNDVFSPTRSPTLCVYSATESADAVCPDPADLEADSDRASRCPEIAIAATDVVFVHHQLPGGVEAPGPLQLRVRTPCGAWQHEVNHVNGVAMWSWPAPPGAECSLTVEAVIANSELGCTVPAAGSEACIDIASQCPDSVPADAGP